MPKEPVKNRAGETEAEVETSAGAPDAVSASSVEVASPNNVEVHEVPTQESSTENADQSTGAATEPLAAVADVTDNQGTATIPLPELGDQAMPPLSEGNLVGTRYQVDSLIGSENGTNIYRVVDLQGYRRCWACGSDSSLQGDTYCVECGAQLTGRRYRLQEFPMPADQPPGRERATMPLPLAILDNSVPGLPQVYDTLQSPEEGRAYVVWEEVYGRPLSSWLPGTESDAAYAGPSGHLAIAEDPGEEQTLAWMSQAAELLARLHAEGIVGCDMKLDNLLVQPGDRLLLIDPSACHIASADLGDQETESARMSDVHKLATELERWYLAVRDEGTPTTNTPTETPQNGHATNEHAAMVAADKVTGPLGNRLTPTTVLIRAREGVYPTAEAFAQALQELYEASKPLTNLQLWSGRASDIGRVRQINEDSVLTLEATVLEHEGTLPVGLYVVADGMGGHQSGEVASSIAARTVGAVINSSLVSSLVAGDPVARDAATCAGLLQHAVLEANRRISDLAHERHSDLGTTIVSALVVGNQVSVASVGDSRVYAWHDGHLSPITRDHSLVAQLVAAGQIAPEDIYTHPRRNEIYRALGDPRLTENEVDIFTYRLQPGDGLLLCSDGLWDFVRDPVIASIIASQETGDPQAICDALIDRANEAGGEDNISAVFMRVVALGEE